MADGAIRAPRSLTEAQRLCEQWAGLDGEIAAIEAARDAAIAAANAEVDKDLSPLVQRRAAIEAKLAPWWKDNAQLLTKGKRKSAELGGAMLGTRVGKGRVTVAGAVDAVVEALRKNRTLGRLFVRPKFELDKAKVTEGLKGKHADALKALGLGFEPGAETFYIERTGQAGTPGKLGAKVQP
jgi:phage host-nuclease inhibitor protein Gam